MGNLETAKRFWVADSFPVLARVGLSRLTRGTLLFTSYSRDAESGNDYAIKLLCDDPRDRTWQAVFGAKAKRMGA